MPRHLRFISDPGKQSSLHTRRLLFFFLVCVLTCGRCPLCCFLLVNLLLRKGAANQQHCFHEQRNWTASSSLFRDTRRFIFFNLFLMSNPKTTIPFDRDKLRMLEQAINVLEKLSSIFETFNEPCVRSEGNNEQTGLQKLVSEMSEWFVEVEKKFRERE